MQGIQSLSKNAYLSESWKGLFIAPYPFGSMLLSVNERGGFFIELIDELSRSFFSKKSVDSAPLPLRVSLPKVVEVSELNWRSIGEIAESWAILIKENYLRLGQVRGLFLFNMSLYICNSIAKEIKEYRENKAPVGSEPWDTLYVYEDASKGVQAIALYDKKSNKLAYIATHPNNIKHPANPLRVRGSGSAIMTHLIAMSKLNKRPIRLNATQTAVGFYEKLGFVNEVSHRNPYSSVTPMIYRPHD
jgi:hypothetical protein